MSVDDALAQLVAIMAALRDKQHGCPWDIEQNFATIAPFTIEEAHEVADAIARGDMVDLKEELGDLLLQVVYHTRLAEEAGHFALPEVIAGIIAKMRRRHPHVFGTQAEKAAYRGDSARVTLLWNEIKRAEKAERAKARQAQGLPDDAPKGFLGSVSTALPAFARALKLQEKAAKVGFDWPDSTLVLDKIAEEITEIREAMAEGQREAIEDEIGDLLFATVNLARHAGIDPEASLQRASRKFERRFLAIETALAAGGKQLHEADLAEMEALWLAAKANEKA